MAWVVAVIVLATVGGELARRRVFAGRDPNDQRVWAEALRVKELVVPVRLLASLLLAFVVVSVFGSYRSASDHAATEAGAVLAMGEQATLLQGDARAQVLGALRCYTRAVAGPDWRRRRRTVSCPR